MKNNFYQLSNFPNKNIPSPTQVIFIRHAQSVFNYDCHTTAKIMKINHLSWDEQEKNEEFKKRVCYNKKYIDCGLSPKGVQQCQQTSASLKEEYPIDLILVSPQLRALQTCNLVFQNKKIPVIVEPLLSQSCRYACDVIRPNISEKKKKFPNYIFNENCEQKYAYELDSKVRDLCEERLKFKEEQQKQEELMKMMKQKQLQENNSQLRARAWKVKEMLERYGTLYPTICVISHWYLLTTVLSKKFSDKDENLAYIQMENCKHYKCKLDQLLKIK